MTLLPIIVADDLTGALGGAAAWGPRWRACVPLTAGACCNARAGVVALDTDTRYRDPAQAARTVAGVIEQAVARGAPLYKKIDSTLRGNTAVEIAAALRAFAGARGAGAVPATALVAPAFPDTGRTVIDGIVHVNGQPLATKRDNLAARLAAAGLKAAVIDRATVRAGPAALAAAYDAHRAAGAEAMIVDTEGNADLEAIPCALRELGPAVLPVGSAGLLRALASANATARTRAIPPIRPGHTLITLGSYSELAHAQGTALRAAGIPAVSLRPPFAQSAQQRAAEALRAAIAADDGLLWPDPNALVDHTLAQTVAQGLAQTTAALLKDDTLMISALILSGGETARAVLTAAGVDRLTVHGEIEPGVVHASAAGLTLVTKAGAFGDAGTLERARHWLSRQRQAPTHTLTDNQGGHP
jgi:4-hydroxythreonine-4-phosphate dehydrogenase